MYKIIDSKIIVTCEVPMHFFCFTFERCHCSMDTILLKICFVIHLVKYIDEKFFGLKCVVILSFVFDSTYKIKKYEEKKDCDNWWWNRIIYIA